MKLPLIPRKHLMKLHTKKFDVEEYVVAGLVQIENNYLFLRLVLYGDLAWTVRPSVKTQNN